MDHQSALAILGASPSSTSQEVEDLFRSLAAKNHPDKGGTNEDMARLIEARRVILAELEKSSALVPLSQLESALTAATNKLSQAQDLRARIEESKKELRLRSTNRLRRYQRYAGIAAAVSGAALFLGKDLPSEFFPEPGVMDISQQERSKSLRRMWVIGTFSIAMYAGFGAWFFTSRIQKTESMLQRLDEETATKSLLHTILRRILGDKVADGWTLTEFVTDIESWATSDESYSRLVRDVGALSFAQYLTAKGEQLSLLAVSELLQGGHLVERYSVQTSANA